MKSITRFYLSIMIAGCVTTILPSASAANWGAQGVPVCTAPSYQQDHQITSDEHGGLIAVWTDYRGDTLTNWDIYAQRITGSGIPSWTSDGVLIAGGPAGQSHPVIVGDDEGGAIVAWEDDRNGVGLDIYAQRIGADGATVWSTNGVPICSAATNQSFPVIAPDGEGGAIIAWTDSRNFADVYAQRVDADGNVQWAVNGIVVCDAYNAQIGCRIVPDGFGGAILAWGDTRAASGTADMYAQRINGLGAPLWTPNGNQVSGAPGQQAFPEIAADGTGGAVVAWADYRTPASDSYAQRMNAAGSPLWAADGSVQCAAAGNQYPRAIVSDGAGGAVTVWEDGRKLTPNYDIYAQRFDASGVPVWTADGLPICTAADNEKEPTLVGDGSGGFIIVWKDGRGSYYNVFAQHVDVIGTILWTSDGIAVAPAATQQMTPLVTSDGGGGALIVWQQGTGSYDLYAQRLSGSGQIPSAVRPTQPPSFSLGPNVPNPFSSRTRLDLFVGHDTDGTMDVYDVAGKRVASQDLPGLSTGWQQIQFDGRDARGQLLPSGIYFVRVKTAGQSLTRKIVIQR